MNAIQIPKDEHDDNFRLTKAKQHLEYTRSAEVAAIKSLNDAREASKRAKEKYEALFTECEQRAVARRKSGKVIVSSQY